MQYPPPMKSGSNTKNSHKFYLFNHDNRHDTKEYHALKKDIKYLLLEVAFINL